MSRRLAPLALILGLAASSACKQRKNTSEVKADFVDAKPTDGQTWTEARIISFNRYAEDLLNYSGNERATYNEAALQLDTSLKRAGVTKYDPLSSYMIQLGNYGECFGQDRGDHQIWWNSHRDAIKKQIEEVAFFVRDYHYLMLGKSRGPFSFREVIICPAAEIGAKMLLDGYKLYIGVPYSMGYCRPIANTGQAKPTLRSLWDDGHPLGIADAGKGLTGKIRALFNTEEKARVAMKTLWTLFNPLSTARQGLRKLLHEQRGTVLPALARLRPNLENASESVREGLLDLAFPNRGKAASGANLTAQATSIAEDHPATLAKAADNWKCLLDAPDAMADVENDAMAMVQDNIKRTNVQNDVEAGLVAVVNHHDVSVLVAAGSGDYDAFLDASVINEFNVTSRVRAGLVAVSTSDNISIDVRFLRSSGKALRGGSFTKALEAARRDESLCGTGT